MSLPAFSSSEKMTKDPVCSKISLESSVKVHS